MTEAADAAQHPDADSGPGLFDDTWSQPLPAADLSRHRVTAVLVAHDGARWLPGVLTALSRLEAGPDRLVVVDTGSTDATPSLLARLGPQVPVVTLPRDTGYAAAVHAGLDRLPTGPDASGEGPAEAGAAEGPGGPPGGPAEWVWLLHDDSAPRPDALGRLLAAAEASPSLAVLGPKVLGWEHPRRLLEVGLTVSGGGRRETGLERLEVDQGQHDGQRDVLAVGSPGMLVRRDVWDELGGLDARIEMFREDLDLGWRANLAGHRVAVVTEAVVHHAEAASRGRRPIAVGEHRPHLLDRASALYVQLANASSAAVVPRALLLVLGSLLRALGLLLAKVPGEASDELRALVLLLRHPGRVWAGRRARRGTRHVRPRALRPLFPARGHQLRHAVDATAGLLAAGASRAGAEAGAGESGPVDEDLEAPATGGSGRLRRALRRPGTLLGLSLLAVALVAGRTLVGHGVLFGGALLAPYAGASDLFAAYAQGWHPVLTGSPAPAPPGLAVLGCLAVLAVGRPDLAVFLLLVLTVPVSGALAYLAAGRFAPGSRRVVRAVAAAGYALAPALTGAVAQGRLGTVLLGPLLPLLALAGARVVGDRERPGTWRAVAVFALLLAVATGAVPVLLLVAAALALVGVVVVRGRAARARVVVAALAPWLLLVPWSPTLLRSPQLLVLEAGAPLTGAGVRGPAWQVLLLTPGGAGTPWPWLTLGVALAGLAALLRPRLAAVRSAWVVAAVACLGALGLAALRVTPPTSAQPVPTWPGPLVLVLHGALLLAAVAASVGARARVRRATFGWRQPAASLLAVLVVLAPVTTAVAWLDRGAGGPVTRGNPDVVPAFVAAAAAQPQQVRTLVLHVRYGRLTYTVLRDRGPRVGDAWTAPDAARLTGLDRLVADVASGRGGGAAAALAGYAIGYVVVAPPVDPGLAHTLDSVPGLVRTSASDGSALWTQQRPTARLRLLAADGRLLARLPSGATSATVTVPAGPAGRVLALAENEDRRWSAAGPAGALGRLTVDDWAQGFAVPAAGGTLTVRYHDGPRASALWAQAVLVCAAVVLALPGRRREPDDEADGVTVDPTGLPVAPDGDLLAASGPDRGGR